MHCRLAKTIKPWSATNPWSESYGLWINRAKKKYIYIINKKKFGLSGAYRQIGYHITQANDHNPSKYATWSFKAFNSLSMRGSTEAKQQLACCGRDKNFFHVRAGTRWQKYRRRRAARIMHNALARHWQRKKLSNFIKRLIGPHWTIIIDGWWLIPR